MTRSSKVSRLIAFAAITALAAAPLLAASGGGMTTADLALQLARAAGVNLPANASPEAARESLGKAGIKLGSDLKAPVTEKALVQVGLAVGLSVSTSRPGAAVTPVVGSAFVQLIKGALQRAAAIPGEGGTDIIHASCQGRASRAARHGTPASPADFDATAGPCETPEP